MDPNVPATPAEPTNTATSPANSLPQDPWLYRGIVIVLGIVVVVCTCGYVGMGFLKLNDPPDALVAIGSAALGGLTGLLAPSPMKR